MQDKQGKILLMLVAPIVAIAVQFVPVIPTWEEFKFIASIGICLITFVPAFLILLKPQPLPVVKTRILVILYLLISSLFFLFILSSIFFSNFFDSATIKTLKYADNGATIYLYNHSCFPPDSAAECDSYHGKVKVKIAFTPFAMTKFECSCLFNELQPYELAGNWVKVPVYASRDNRTSEIKININNGEVVAFPQS
ncbi:hypothetical protein [Calothrix sp. 336/3]|uniref:hypothetical protein n=1 Tax=Calothrix sp. 336/3 TaxID=1337936 RepID=UPI0004E38F19|nr:hypothetical protein [Calothrix sp. 336/3]AKG22010.1 hypothetical protein IJ00_12740 [Calothrix sp. 336/3]